MRFSPVKDHGANAGLDVARALLEPIKAKHPAITCTCRDAVGMWRDAVGMWRDAQGGWV